MEWLGSQVRTCFSFWILSSNSACDEVNSCKQDQCYYCVRNYTVNLRQIWDSTEITLTRASICSNPESLCGFEEPTSIHVTILEIPLTEFDDQAPANLNWPHT
jgi:hypothetical protein